MFEQGHCLLHDLFIPLFKLQQRVKFCRCFERALQALMFDDFLQRKFRKKLERTELNAVLIRAQYVHNRCHVGRTQYQYGRLLWRRCEAHGRLHHHSQSTLSANHQLP